MARTVGFGHLVVSGDDHIYERAIHDGVTYIVNGLGGVAAHEVGDPQVRHRGTIGGSAAHGDDDDWQDWLKRR